MKFDCHIHSSINDFTRDDIISKMKEGGFDGGIIFSQSPSAGEGPPAEERIDAVLRIAEKHKYLFPFFFINPTEPDAVGQVKLADRKGILGFKVICFKHFPCDERAMPVYNEIAKLNKPLMFHSGILYDGRNASGNFNRPCNFEGLLSVDRLRFSLAHVSWPWTDECIAVYGKFNYALSHVEGVGGEMFIDLNPGTPAPYRKPMYDRLLFSGYDIKNNLLFGTDNSAGRYNPAYSGEIIGRDEKIFSEYELDEDFRDFLYYKNVLRFIGLPENY